MKFSGVKCFALLVFLPLALSESNSNHTKELKLNSTGVAEDGGRFIKKKVLPCVSIPGNISGIADPGILSGITDFFSGIGDIFTDLLPNVNDLQLPNLDINSLVPNKDKDTLALEKFATIKLPAIFIISILVGAIAAAIVISIPAKFQPEKFMHSMIDSISDFMQQALTDVPAQYGVPQDGYSQQGYQQTGYTPQSGYTQQDSGYSNSGYPPPAPPAQSYGAPAQAYDSQAYQAMPMAVPDTAYPAPATAYNAPSSAYTDPSTAYGSPHRRYNYPSLSSNYLRSEKTRK